MLLLLLFVVCCCVVANRCVYRCGAITCRAVVRACVRACADPTRSGYFFGSLSVLAAVACGARTPQSASSSRNERTDSDRSHTNSHSHSQSQPQSQTTVWTFRTFGGYGTVTEKRQPRTGPGAGRHAPRMPAESTVLENAPPRRPPRTTA